MKTIFATIEKFYFLLPLSKEVRILRDRLAYHVGKRLVFTGRIEQYQWDRNERMQVVIKDPCFIDGRRIDNHILLRGDIPGKLKPPRFRPGVEIGFSAVVTKYERLNGSLDYGLTNPLRICIIQHVPE